ncbi:MAG: type II secretion system F family protein [Thaumarchaeota archaeon]|jgi:flagellar protein FlaJ|nr:type II secretion system F family protein [Candidatus Geocrenenecus arthurdayi]
MMNDRLLWISSIATSTAAYILYTELMGPGQIIHLIPAGLLLVALMICLGMDPEAPRSFIRKIEERVSAKAEEAGLYVDPLKISYRVAYHIQILVLTCILYGLGVAATYLISGWSPGPFTILFAAPIALPPSIGIYIGIYDKARERLQKTSRELPFFATLASILSRAGLTLYTAFLRVSRAHDVMPQMAREAGRVKRDVALGIGVTDALMKLAEKHPFREFKMMILGTISVWRSGGDVAVTLEGYAKSLLKALEDSWDRYSKMIGLLGEALAIIFMILPLGIGVVSIAFSQFSSQLMLFSIVGVVPALAMMIYAVVRSSDPVMPDRYSIPSTIPLAMVLAIMPSTVVQVVRMLPQTSLMLQNIPYVNSITASIGVLAASIIIYYSMRGQISEVEEAEQALPRFVRDVTEYRKLGYTIVQSIEKCLQNPYPKSFRDFLRKVYGRVRMAASLSEAARDHRSWLVRTVFTLLEEAEESGGGNPELFEKIEDLLRTHLGAKSRARGAVKLYMYMAMGIPFIVSFSAALLMNIAFLIAPIGQMSAMGMPMTLAKPEDIAAGLDMAMILALEGAVVTAFIAGRAVDHHPYGTWRISLAAVSFILAVVTLPYMQNMTSALFGISPQATSPITGGG